MEESNGVGSIAEVANVCPSRAHQSVAMADSYSGTSVSEPPPFSNLNLLDLPIEILEKIFSYLNYDTVARLRPVCQQMEHICASILNSTILKLKTQMLNRYNAIEAQIPKPESICRNHQLVCESHIIETLHMRLTLLQMSFGNHVERAHCCSFPGKMKFIVFYIT
ncbi:F-box only protein 28-like isoform X2 [Colletes latitarsis]|uniref:F-box only protein 28-like isoform X2 n=1 Tax=Colletes latitarsis TaxID=2605962 RepID=UPI0040375C13